MTAPRAVLFDLDGTLIDTAPDLGYAANLVRGELGLAPLPLSHYRPVASAGARGLLKAGLGYSLDHPDYPKLRDRFLEHYRANLSRESRLFPDMDVVLRDFEKHGIRWGVVTNKPYWLAEPLLHDLALLERCAVLVGVEPGLAPKPAPDPLLRACERLVLPPSACVYVGDDRRDIDAARAAAMPVLAAAWGYLAADEPIADWNADAIVPSPAALLEALGLAKP